MGKANRMSADQGRLRSSVDTPATRAATLLGIPHEVRVIERAQSLEEAAERLGVAPGQLLKTLVVRRGADDYLFVVLPGDREIGWPLLRRHLGVSRLSMPSAEVARDVTGYERGAITPFGASTPWPVIVDASVVGSGIVTIGGGAHGVSLAMDADVLLDAIDATDRGGIAAVGVASR